MALEVILMHKRSQNKLQQRKIQTIILNGSYRDKQHAEIISKLTKEEIIRQLKEPIKSSPYTWPREKAKSYLIHEEKEAFNDREKPPGKSEDAVKLIEHIGLRITGF